MKNFNSNATVAGTEEPTRGTPVAFIRTMPNHASPTLWTVVTIPRSAPHEVAGCHINLHVVELCC